MGVVYEAEQLSLSRQVALKVLPHAAVVDRTAITRFKNESRAAAGLNHPQIVSVYAVGEDRGVHYYAMQLIRGQTIAELIRDLRATRGVADQASEVATDAALSSRTKHEFYRAAARLRIQASEALQHVHDQGVLHRDIKPGNFAARWRRELACRRFWTRLSRS